MTVSEPFIVALMTPGPAVCEIGVSPVINAVTAVVPLLK